MNITNITKKSRLTVRLIILIISAAGLILFYYLKGNGHGFKWISQNLEFTVVYLLFFIGINMPVYKIFFGLYWRYLKKPIFIFNKQNFLIDIFIFAAILILFIFSIFIAESMAIASVLILIAQYGLSENVIFKNGDDIYYTSDTDFTDKKINNVDFLKNKKQVVYMIRVSVADRNKNKIVNLPVLPEDADKMENSLL